MTLLDGSVGDPAHGRITIYDIARRSGVSPATVSRYLNGTGNISAPFRQRIATTIEELDYQPSQVARALAVRRTGLAVLAVPSIDNPRWPEVAVALESRLADAGLSLVLINLGSGRERELAGLDRVYRMRAEVLAVSMLTYEPGDLDRLRRAGTHVVSVSNDIADPSIDAVLPDRATAVHLAVEHLTSLGHRRIALVDGPSRQPGVRVRIDAYREARERAALADEPERIVHVHASGSAGREAVVGDFLATGASAALVVNDAWAIDLWIGLERAGFGVPGDYSIVGMDDIPVAAFVRTGLTTLAIDRAARGRLAADLLIGRRNATDAREPRRISIAPRLVVRSSTAPPSSASAAHAT